VALFGAGVTEIPGEEFAVPVTAPVDRGAGGTPGEFCKGEMAIPDGSVTLAAGIAPAGGDGPSRASTTPPTAVARQMATAPRTIPIFKRIMMSSGDDVRPQRLLAGDNPHYRGRPQIFVSFFVSGKNI
jgi:hypothetical protein